MALSLNKLDIVRMQEILNHKRQYLNDKCIEIYLTAMDKDNIREKFLIITEVNRQLPFNKEQEIINIDRITKSMKLYMKSRFVSTQEAIIIIYNRPENYFPQRDSMLQNVPKPHWFVICITFKTSSLFKIKLIDSWYERNMKQKENVMEEAGLYITTIVKIFMELKERRINEMILKSNDFNIIACKKQSDGYSCGDYCIEAVKCIIENKTWVKPGKNEDQLKLKHLNIELTRSRIKHTIDEFYLN